MGQGVGDGVVAAGYLLDDFVMERREFGKLFRDCRVMGSRLQQDSRIINLLSIIHNLTRNM